MPGLTPSSPPNASGTVRGLVSTVAQTFAGVKTFLATIIASAGVQVASLFNTNGTGLTDVVVRVGTTQTYAATNANAQVLWVGTGVGGTPVTAFYVTKDGVFVGGGAVLRLNDINGAVLAYSTARFEVAGGFLTLASALGNLMRFAVGTGEQQLYGTDTSGSPGAATINRPSGISAIASGATSVTITNSLVAAGSRVLVTWHADHGAARWWVTRAAGSFTVTLSAAATANAAFSWEVSTII